MKIDFIDQATTSAAFVILEIVDKGLSFSISIRDDGDIDTIMSHDDAVKLAKALTDLTNDK